MLKNLLEKIKQDFAWIIVIVVPLIAGIWLLMPGYFPMHDDVQVMRLYEMEKCLKDGQIPCRWVPDMGAGYGHPLFNYHPVFPYYAGMIFRLVGFSFVDTAKLLFFVSLLLSGIFMYILAREFFGKAGGIVASVLFVIAPYHSVDIYVRGALTEAWGLVFSPLIFWSLYKYIKSQSFKYFIIGILSLSFLFLSHNIMTFVFTPLGFLWGLYWIFTLKKQKLLGKYFLIFIWATGLAAFFLFPSILEINLGSLETMTVDNYQFKDHFVSFYQLFLSRNWDYGFSIPGYNDPLSFQLGWPHWILSFMAMGMILLNFIRRKKNLPEIVILAGFFLFSIFMTLPLSQFFWQGIAPFKFVQFPWRYLAVSIFTMSLLSASLFKIVALSKKQILAAAAIIILALALNLSYFKPRVIDPGMNDGLKLSGWEWDKQSKTTLEDYVPRSVKLLPIFMAPKNPWVFSGQATITSFEKRSDYFKFTAETIGNDKAVIEVPIFYFPTWDILINQSRVNFSVNPDTGVIQIPIPSGKSEIAGWFKNTPIRKVSNMITVISFISLLFLIALKGTKDEENI